MNLRLFVICFLCHFFVNVVISSRVSCHINCSTILIRNLSGTIKDTCPEETLVISFINAEVSKISKDFLRGMNKLYKINISDVHLKTIEPGAFEDLPDLSYLSMENNNLTIIRSGTFVNSSTLESIILSNNHISSLGTGAFTNLRQLYRLGLSKRGVFVNVTTVSFDLSENRIFKIESGAFSGFVKPKYFVMNFNLGRNKLQEINSAVFNHPNLTRLNLSSNEISQLRPGDLANLPGLINLDLSHNKLKNIPDGVFNSTKMEILNLASNQLSKIASGAFDNLTFLRKICLDSNSLTRLESDWFRGCSKLTELSVTNNHIQEIPEDAFKNLPKLLILS